MGPGAISVPLPQRAGGGRRPPGSLGRRCLPHRGAERFGRGHRCPGEAEEPAGQGALREGVREQMGDGSQICAGPPPRGRGMSLGLSGVVILK